MAFSIAFDPLSPGGVNVSSLLQEAYGQTGVAPSQASTGSVYQAPTSTLSPAPIFTGGRSSKSSFSSEGNVTMQPFMLQSNLQNGQFSFADTGAPSFNGNDGAALPVNAALAAFQSVGQQANNLNYQVSNVAVNAITGTGMAGLNAGNQLANQMASNLNTQSILQQINLLFSGPRFAGGSFG